MPVPADVLARIKADAAEQWRGDYSMQAHTIREQTQAYEKMDHFRSNLDMSNEIISTCYGKSLSEWPTDFTMQVHIFEQQTQDAIAFFNYENGAIPNNIVEEIKQFAFSEWPGDYTMMLHIVGEQAEAWLDINR